jgi:hypothetical protein
MIFEELNTGSQFLYGKGSFVKVKPFIGIVDGKGTTFNCQSLDDHKFFSFRGNDEVVLDFDRENFEKLWESNKDPIDKALCYKFYKLGINQ